jgi:hypothetical protein
MARGLICLVVGLLLLSLDGLAQGRGGAPQAPPTPRASAPVDLTGYWVSVISEDWRFRMVTAAKGDFEALPLTAEGTRVGNQWDPQKDISAGEQCRAFGAAGIMRLPVRLHVTWQDEATLKMDIDNGNQVRLFRFDRSVRPPAQPEWQGFSSAEWETVAEGQGVAAGRGSLGPTGSLKVVTTRMKPGYLRRNGVPYSANAVLTEFFDRTELPDGSSWLILTSIVNDPQYLQMPLVLSTQYKREADGSKFSPRPCEVTMPLAGGARR